MMLPIIKSFSAIDDATLEVTVIIGKYEYSYYIQNTAKLWNFLTSHCRISFKNFNKYIKSKAKSFRRVF